MLRHCLTAILRTLARDRRYTALNILGLAAGFAAAIFIFLFVRNDLSYDRFLPDYRQTYLVTELDQVPGHAAISTPMVWFRLAGAMKLYFPQIEAIARLCPEQLTIRQGAVEADEKIYWADPDLFKVLRLPVLAGDLRSALSDPDGIAITRSLARKYFGRDAPIGETLLIENSSLATGSHPMRVTAVLADLPPNTHLDLKVIAAGHSSISALRQLDIDETKAPVYNIAYTYLRLKPGVSATEVQRGIPAFLTRRLPPGFAAVTLSMPLVRIDRVHLTPETEQSMRPADDRTTVYALGLIGCLIIGVAGINFVNLMTARGARRAVEIGVRKVAGASRLRLIGKFMGETVLYAVLAMILAITLAELLLPRFNAYLERDIGFTYWRDPVLAMALVTLPLLVGILAGAYPALVLSAFRPAAVLKGAVRTVPGAGRLRQVLVALQFSVLITLAIASFVIFRQVRYALHEGLRVDQDQVLLIPTPCRGAFPDRIRGLSGVRAAACAFSASLNLIEEAHWWLRRPDGKLLQIDGDSVDYGFLELFGLSPLAGRFFSQAHPGDAASNDLVSTLQHGDRGSPDPAAPPVGRTVLNEAAVRLAGFDSPQEAVGKILYVGGRPLEIIGVVRDFSFDSVRKQIAPAFYVVYPDSFDMLTVKLDGRHIPEALASIEQSWHDSGQIKPLPSFFLDAHMQSLYLDVSRRAQVFSVFCAITVLICCIGLLGLAAFTAERRTREIGIRKAFGADTRDVLRLLLWQFSKPVMWANLIAWPVAGYIMSRWLAGFAYHITLPLWLFPSTAAGALAVALLTVATHSILVARAPPVAALRYE